MELWSTSVNVDDEFEKLVRRVNPPRVTVDNASSRSATLVKVESANKYGSLLQVVQVLTDLNLTINRAYISSDGEWFMDVFYVTDQYGNKLSDLGTVEKIQQSLGARPFGVHSLKRSVGVQPAAEHTTIELIGRDRPGLLSEIFAVLADLKCNVVASEVWTHNSRMASVVYVTDEDTGLPVNDLVRLSTIKQLLRHVLKGEKDKKSAQTALSVGGTHTQRRLHQMLYADRDYDSETSESVQGMVNNINVPLVTVENCVDKGYTLVTVSSCDRPKLLFDTVCTLTDMQYVVFHARIIAEGAEASQEYYIRHMDGCPVSSEAEKRRLIHCLKAAIRRRSSQGLRLELCGEDRVGLLSEVTRIFRENGLSVTQAEVKTRGSRAVNVFYVTDAAGNPVNSETIEAIRKDIGETILHVKEETPLKNASQESARFSLGNLFRSSSEKFLYNLGLIKTFS